MRRSTWPHACGQCGNSVVAVDRLQLRIASGVVQAEQNVASPRAIQWEDGLLLVGWRREPANVISRFGEPDGRSRSEGRLYAALRPWAVFSNACSGGPDPASKRRSLSARTAPLNGCSNRASSQSFGISAGSKSATPDGRQDCLDKIIRPVWDVKDGVALRPNPVIVGESRVFPERPVGTTSTGFADPPVRRNAVSTHGRNATSKLASGDAIIDA